MGRTEPTVVKPPAAFRRDARAKRARATVNKVIPALLSAHPRARRGIERSELIVDPPRLGRDQLGTNLHEGKPGEEGPGLDAAVQDGRKARGGGRRKTNSEPKAIITNDTSNSRVKKESGEDDDASNGLRITLCVGDTLAAAHSLLNSSGPSPSSFPSTQQQDHQQRSHDERVIGKSARLKKVGILNMASPLSPGGGFLNGATSQEESLCMRTTLLPALRDEFYRLPELGVVYTPDVLVFRAPAGLSNDVSSTGGGEAGDLSDDRDILPKTERWHVDVVSAAMLRLPETEDGAYANPADRELVLRKMRAVLRVFAAKGCARIVLGAWGCGAYGNPVAEIARAWRRVLGPEHGIPGPDGEGNADRDDAQRQENRENKRNGTNDKKSRRKKKNDNHEPWGTFFEEVIFAVKDGNLATSFARAFGEDVMHLPPASLSGDDHGDGSLSSTVGDELDPVEVARVSELRGKIAQLEAQIEETRSLQMRGGLESVLANLRRQLPGGDDDNEEGSVVSGQGSSSEGDEVVVTDVSE